MKPVNAGQAAAVALVDELVRCGVRYAFLSPGSRSSPVAYALAEANIDLTVCIDERSAAFMALGSAKRSGLPAVAACTSGTAAANFHPAVVEARMSSVPMIVLTADRPPELRETGAGQTIDQVKIFGTDVRWFFDPGVPEARETTNALFRSIACRASAEATGPPGGPVHLNLPFRDPLVPEADADGFPYALDGRSHGEPWSKRATPRVLPNESSITEVARLISTNEEGLILAGSSGATSDAVIALAEAAGWPLIAEPASGARIDKAISCSEALLRSSWAESAHPKIVVKIGSLTTSKVLLAHIADAIQITIDDSGAWRDPDRSSSMLISGDASAACGSIAEQLTPRIPSAWLSLWTNAEAAARSAIDSQIDVIEQVSEPRVARDLAKHIPDGGLLFVASSMPVRDLDWFMAPRNGLRVLSNRGANGIDGTLSSALGAAMAHDGPAFALMGDLAFLHDQTALLTPRKSRPNLVVVVVNNDGGGIFSFLPQSQSARFEELFATPHGTDIASLCAAHRVDHVAVDHAGDLAGLLAAASSSPGITVVEAKTDRSVNLDVHRKIWAAVSDALS